MAQIRNRAGGRLVAAGGIWVGLMAGWAAASEQAPGTRPSAAGAPSSKPATSQPADGRVLVRLGDRDVITQADFEAYYRGSRPMPFDAAKDTLLREMIETRYFLLYLAEYPDLVTEKVIDVQIENLKKRENLKTPEDVQNWFKKNNMTEEAWRQRWRLIIARGVLVKRGQAKAKDEAALKQRFEQDPTEFNGTELSARHILIGVLPFETAEERKIKREKVEQIRKDLLAGKLTWEEAVRESTCPTRPIGGKLGTFTRHFKLMEGFTAAMFKLEVQKLSDVIETPLGYHIVEVTRRIPGTRSFEDAKRDMKLWMEREAYLDAISEVRRKYPTIGVQPPRPVIIERPVQSAESRPARTRPAGQPRSLPDRSSGG